MSKHLLIIGGGSAAITAAKHAIACGARVTLAHDGLPIGGTCLHVGCVPSKFMIRAAEATLHTKHSRFAGLKPLGVEVDFARVMADQKALVDELRRVNYEEPLPKIDGLRLIRGRGRLLDGYTMQAGEEIVAGDAVLVATGSRSALPPLSGLAESAPLTNETVFELRKVPARLVVLGGGYIALELAQMMSRFGSEVTVLQRSDHILSDQPADLGETLTSAFEEEGIRVLCGTTLQSVECEGDERIIRLQHLGENIEVRCDQIFVGLGRRGNTDDIGLEGCGVQVDSSGFIQVNDRLETACSGVYAAGDVLGRSMFVYTASYEAEIAVDHMLGKEDRSSDYPGLPWVVFTDPQVAGVGVSEQEAIARGYDVDVAVLPVARWPRFRVSGHTRGYLSMVRNRETDHLLGARVIAPEGGDLVSELSMILRQKIPLTEVAKHLYPYLTLSEGIGLCASRFE